MSLYEHKHRLHMILDEYTLLTLLNHSIPILRLTNDKDEMM